jgi:hypothetical protein
MQVLPMRRPLQLQHHLAPKTDVFLGDGDGVPGQATPTPLFDASTGVFELELRLVFFLLKLHEGADMAQLMLNVTLNSVLNGARGGGGGVLVSQREWDREAARK